MKKCLIILFILLIAKIATAQKIDREMLIGNWTVKEVLIQKDLSAETTQLMNLMAKMLVNSHLLFKSEGKFSIIFQNNIPDLLRELQVINNKDWKFDENEQLISIGTKTDNYNHMRMYVIQRQKGIIYFAFNDTPLMLEMVKDSGYY